MSTEHIRMYLAFNYSDEQLAALLAHAESGKLGFMSCCCLIGIPTATHPLQTARPLMTMRSPCEGDEHYNEARGLPFAIEAENEFMHLGNDARRRELLIPMILLEMERREKAREQSIAAEPAQVG